MIHQCAKFYLMSAKISDYYIHLDILPYVDSSIEADLYITFKFWSVLLVNTDECESISL